MLLHCRENVMRIQRNLNNNYRKSKDEVARKLREVLWSEGIRYRKTTTIFWVIPALLSQNIKSQYFVTVLFIEN